MPRMELLTYLISGAVAGLMAGLLGIGGGLVIVPALALLFLHQGFSADTVMHYAVGTSLATIIPTSISSLLAHQRRGSVHWPVVRSYGAGNTAGGTGKRLAGKANEQYRAGAGVRGVLAAGRRAITAWREAGTASATAGGLSGWV